MWRFFVAIYLFGEIRLQVMVLTFEQIYFGTKLADLLFLTGGNLVKRLDCIFLLGVKHLESGYLGADILFHHCLVFRKSIILSKIRMFLEYEAQISCRTGKLANILRPIPVS